MGSIVATWTALLPSRRWLALFAVPAVIALATPRAVPVCRLEPVNMGLVRLDRLAAAHRAWVADHGEGCARGLDHLTPYIAGAEAPDPWGSPLAFACTRSDGGRTIDVAVTSLGPDRLPGGGDDIVGTDRQQLH